MNLNLPLILLGKNVDWFRMKKIMILCLLSLPVLGQSDTLRVTFGAYLETYYGHSFTSQRAKE